MYLKEVFEDFKNVYITKHSEFVSEKLEEFKINKKFDFSIILLNTKELISLYLREREIDNILLGEKNIYQISIEMYFLFQIDNIRAEIEQRMFDEYLNWINNNQV